MAISLKQLTQLFAQSATNPKLSPAERQFAAQLTLLTGHVGRLNAKLSGLDESVAEIAKLTLGASPAKPESAVQAPSEAAASADVDPEEAATTDMIEKVQQETQAELEALTKPAVTPIRKPKASPQAEQAS
jgi:hypothetical protein